MYVIDTHASVNDCCNRQVLDDGHIDRLREAVEGKKRKKRWYTAD